jgi:hypothetical protein
VGEITGVLVAEETGGSVGRDTAAVFVAGGGGRVGVLNGVDWFNCACTVKAAAVKMAFGSSVAGVFEGRLQAEKANTTINEMEMMRTDLDILFSS